MKMLSANNAVITVSRHNYEWILNRMIGELAVNLIPLASRLIQSATESEAPPNSPLYMAAFTMYMSVNAIWSTIVLTINELAKEEPAYRAAAPFLNLNANPNSHGSLLPLTDMDVKMQQWRLNLHKFIRAIDPESHFLKVGHSFDADPPMPPSSD